MSSPVLHGEIMKKITAVIMGFGDRGQIYASYAQKGPEKFQIIGVVDPDPIRLKKAKKLYDLNDSNCFLNPEDFYKREKFCDVVINATMDNLHVKTTIPLLKAGYDVLLEKPITSNEQELFMLEKTAKQSGRILMICHVLRYAPFYVKIKNILDGGSLGKIQNVFCSENVWIPHVLASYIRGKWSSEQACGSGMLMAKCCHDLDMIVWLCGGAKAKAVSSFGTRSVFTEENKPAGAGTRCLVDCKLQKDCPYSAKKLYIENNLFPFLVWANIKGKDWTEVSEEEKIHSLKTDNPHGSCAYQAKDLVDHQSVLIEFKNGITATLNMTGGASRAGRELHIVCERGEIEGFLESNEFKVRKFNADKAICNEETVFITEDVSGVHSGGDLRLVADFVARVSGETPSISCTSIEDSVEGHLITIAAEKSRKEGRTVFFDNNQKVD